MCFIQTLPTDLKMIKNYVFFVRQILPNFFYFTGFKVIEHVCITVHHFVDEFVRSFYTITFYWAT